MGFVDRLKHPAIILNFLSKSRFFEVKLYCKSAPFLSDKKGAERNNIKLYCGKIGFAPLLHGKKGCMHLVF